MLLEEGLNLLFDFGRDEAVEGSGVTDELTLRHDEAVARAASGTALVMHLGIDDIGEDDSGERLGTLGDGIEEVVTSGEEGLVVAVLVHGVVLSFGAFPAGEVGIDETALAEIVAEMFLGDGCDHDWEGAHHQVLEFGALAFD